MTPSKPRYHCDILITVLVVFRMAGPASGSSLAKITRPDNKPAAMPVTAPIILGSNTT
jgi:hypothetical protein